LSECTPVFLVGSGRSGTTWLMDVLARANRLWTVFEPLNPLASPEAAPFAHRHFGRQSAVDGLKSIIDAHIHRRPRQAWTSYRFYPEDLRYSLREALGSPVDYHYRMAARYSKVAKRELALRKARGGRVIVKFIRANLLLEWLAAAYACPILLMIRHPAAVIRSRMKLDNRYWDFFGKQQQEIVDLYLEILKEGTIYPFSFSTDEARRIRENEVLGCAFLWCFENAYAYNAVKESNAKVIFYEHFFETPGIVLDEAIRYAKLENTPSEETIRKPSQQSSRIQKEKGIHENQLSLWQKLFSSDEMDQIQKMLDAFQIDFYTAKDPMPRLPAESNA
jgi:hypothetical protein